MADTAEASTSSPPPAKKQKLASSEADSSMVDADTQKALEDIEDCQISIEELNDKASEEILQVEMKYIKLRRPHYKKRNKLISDIENFWVTAFLNHPRMANLLDEGDEECLQYLKQVNIEEFEDIKSGFEIKFHFSNNPFFTNDVLTKTFYLAAADGEPRSKYTQIDWKPGSDLTTRIYSSHGHKSHRPARSFFTWFLQATDATKDKVVEMIKDELWPNPLQYFLASEIEVEENGLSDADTDDSDVQHIPDDSVVIVGDDSDDDDDVYEVDDDDDDDLDDDLNEDMSGDEVEETVESIEVEDDDDDDDEDAIEVLGSDSEAEMSHDVHEISDTSLNKAPDPSKPKGESDSIDKIMAAAVETFDTDEAIDKASGSGDAEKEGGDNGKGPDKNKGTELGSGEGVTNEENKDTVVSTETNGTEDGVD